MRNRWYSDNRDLVKWATLTHIARTHRLSTILQVPYLRSEAFHPHFDFEEKKFPIPEKVWRFFRNVHDVTRLGTEIGVSINVVASEFIPNQRNAYVREVEKEMNRSKHPLLLFLDPDTGLQPTKSKPEHTTTDELTALWSMLQPREWLVLYQHARRKSDWVQSVKKQLSEICRNPKVTISRSQDVGQDVAFLCIEK